jgi:hypothetical protein
MIDPSLDQLEVQVLARIAAHRSAHTGALPIGVVVTLSALVVGLAIGVAQSGGPHTSGSETAVLADDAGLAPSTLLASNQ